jgi:hypothetical protein
MKFRIGPESAAAEGLIPPAQSDGSRIGVNYADAYLKALGADLGDGRKVAAKRKGLKVLLTIGEAKGEAVMRRLEHGPDPRAILRRALEAAAEQAGARFLVEDGVMYLEAAGAAEERP